jgi:hypothetical protein
MTKYYSKLPWLSIGSLQVGGEVADEVGRCSGTGVRLEGGECLPDGFLEVSTRRTLCSTLGGEELHSDGTSCVFQEAALCALAGGSPTSAVGPECDLSRGLHDSILEMDLNALMSGGQLSLTYEGGKTSITGVSACPALPSDSPLSAHVQAIFADGQCVLELPRIDVIADLFPACKPAGDGTCVIPIGAMMHTF